MQRVTVEAIESPIMRELLGWYDERCPLNGWPPVSAFRAETIPPRVLPHIARVQITTDPLRVFYRAVGSEFGVHLGVDLTGRYLDELGVEQADDLHEWYREALGSHEPVLMRADHKLGNDSFVYEGGGLPLGTKDDEPREFVSCTDFLNTPAWHSALRKLNYKRPGH